MHLLSFIFQGFQTFISLLSYLYWNEVYKEDFKGLNLFITIELSKIEVKQKKKKKKKKKKRPLTFKHP